MELKINILYTNVIMASNPKAILPISIINLSNHKSRNTGKEQNVFMELLDDFIRN